MNKLIKQFADQADEYADGYADGYNPIWWQLYNEKFAELIIRECVDQTWQPGIYHDTALSELIKHFGIEK